jgi:hypothetical protein
MEGGYPISKSNHINKVISIGSVLDRDELNRIHKVDPHYEDRLYEITGAYDCLLRQPSLRPLPYRYEANTTHVGLLYSSKVHKQIIEWLSD